MTKLYKLLATNIDYCVEEEDVIDLVDSDDEIEIENKINEIKSSLPQALEIECECESDELDDEIADAISNKTGWLINSFDYEIK